MADAAIETGEQGGSLVGDDGGFEVGTGEIVNGVEGVPGGFDGDFDFVLEASSGNGGSEIAGDAAKVGQHIFGKVFEILGKLRCGSSWLVAYDYVPGADFPFLDETVDDIRVFAGEGFNFALVVYVENEQGAVDGFGERAGENEV